MAAAKNLLAHLICEFGWRQHPKAFGKDQDNRLGTHEINGAPGKVRPLP